MQLYTVRGVLPKQPLETLRAIEKLGYREVECTAGGLDELWPHLKQASLKPVSIHLATPLFSAEKAKLPAAIEDAKKKGFAYVVCPYIAPADRGGPDVMKRLGDTLNQAGEMSRKLGVHLCYHNHAFEFEPSGSGTLLDVLMQAADPKLVSLELDVMWVRVSGADPAQIVAKYGKRVALMHLKNVEKGTEQRFNEQIPRTAFRDVGTGMVDIPAVLRAAHKVGVKHYFVEQDQTPGDPIDSLGQSCQYLQGLDF